MCGIAGKLDFSGGGISQTLVSRMCAAIEHRGPDSRGIWCQGPIGLGMQRLAIIDVAGGDQPIFNEDGSVCTVYNGEIYNFPELKTELESRGHVFYTRSDTEVIVHLYEELGSDCVTKLRGMFAVAVYDERNQKLLLARDRLGKKPLHYAVSEGRLLFGSEIKALLAEAPHLTQIDQEALLQYFYFGYIPDPATVFSGIRKLPPGCLLEYSSSGLKIRSYWDVPAYGEVEPLSEEDCLKQLEEQLYEAVRIRLISDVPLGALLSGGVDSSIVVAFMARASARPVQTFSIGFAHQDFDEAQYARAVAQRFGTDHHELVVEPNLQETLEILTRSLEEPFGDSSMIPTYHVTKMARQYVTVALSGDGGDELFAGYDRYLVNLSRRKFDSIPQWIGRTFREGVYPHVATGVYGRRLLFSASLASRDRYIDNVSHLPALDRERYLFSDDLLAWADKASPTQTFREYFDDAPASDLLSRMMYLDTKTYLTADVLAKVDRMSMANSLEVRCPLLDHVFVEHAASLPASWKLRHGQRKYILKKLAERVGVPREVLYRPKQGFAMPLSHWWRNELKNDMLQILLEPRTLQRGYFNARSVRVLVDEHIRARRDRSYEIWLLLILELWHRNFLEQTENRQVGIDGNEFAHKASSDGVK